MTILDAHPDIAMSYELYPNLLSPLTEGKLDTCDFFEILSGSRNGKKLEQNPDCRLLQIFINRSPRSGLERKDLASLVKEHLGSGDDFRDVASCLRFIERCAVKKMRNESKSQWGLKCSNNFQEYIEIWPGSRFLNVVRDGRDVLASQINTGSFNKSPIHLGRAWTNTHKKFRSLVEDSRTKAYEVYYERLVREPEDEIQRICEFLEVPFDTAMVYFYKKELTIYNSSHLSMNRIRKPIDASKIGRWKKELSGKQLEEFYSEARDTMVQFGYLADGEC